MAQMAHVEKVTHTVILGNYYRLSVAKIKYDVYLLKTDKVSKKRLFSSKMEKALTPREIEIIQLLYNVLSAKKV